MAGRWQRECLPLEVEMLPLYRAETRSLRAAREPRRHARRLVTRFLGRLRASGHRSA